MQALYASGSAEGYVYSLRAACAIGGQATCLEPAVCPEPPGSRLFDVLRSPATEPREWTVVGQTCLTDEQAGALGAITPGMVLEAFRSLTWPAPALTVQPPGGETLVNLETNFLTDLTEPQTQQVTLLGIRVTIEATPASYIWHFGDGTDTSTATPGAAYPDLDVTHIYLDAGLTVRPSVDVVYAGRYRIGGGDWSAIPGSHTVAGPAVPLRVLEARPQLVGRSSTSPH